MQALHRFSNRYRLETYGTCEGVGMQVISVLVSVLYWPGQGIHCTGAVPVAARQSATSALSAGLLRDFPFYLVSEYLGGTASQILRFCFIPCLAFSEVRSRPAACPADACDIEPVHIFSAYALVPGLDR